MPRKRSIKIGDRLTWYQMMIGGELAKTAPTRIGKVIAIMGAGGWDANLAPSRVDSYIVEHGDTGRREIISLRQVVKVLED